MDKVAVYKNQLKGLFPRGRLWSFVPDGVLDSLCEGIAAELARIDERAATLIEEADPRTTFELLDDWERLTGLPGECGLLATTTAERRAQIVSKLISAGPQSVSFFIQIAASVGYDLSEEDFQEFFPFVAGGSGAGDEVSSSDEWAHTFLIRVDAVNIRPFLAGQNGAGDRLLEFGDDLFECVINDSKQAHTKILFSYPSG